MASNFTRTSIALFCAGISGVAASGTISIPGTGTGAIPDNNATGLEVSFDVAALQDISDIQLDIDIEHTWVGDLDVSLIAPNGDEHIIFSDTGSGTGGGLGDSSNLFGTYRFSDSLAAPVNWWNAAAAITGSEVIPNGNYRTTTGGNASGNGIDTAITAAFADNYQAGTWKLKLVDEAGGDLGTINSASLSFMADLVLTTSFAGGNGASGNFFNITAKQKDITIRSFDINIDTGTRTASAYTKSGTYVGFELDAGAWRSIGSASVTGVTNTPTPFDVNDVTIPAGQTQGFLVFTEDSGFNYTNGVGSFENIDISLFSNKGMSFPAFAGAVFSPRFWNGTVHYDYGDGTSCYVTVASNGNVITFCL